MAKYNQGGNGMSEQQFQQQYADRVQSQRLSQEVEQQMGKQFQRQSSPSWMQKPLSPEAKAYFSQPAKRCQMCGVVGTLGQTGIAERDEWELKWSVHHDCAHAVWDQLDRAAGVASQRK